MNVAALSALFLVATLAGFAKPENKRITVCLFVVAWVLMCLNMGNPDYEGYEARYYAFDQPWVAEITPSGFLFLTELGNSLGLNFFSFRLLMCTASLLLVFTTVVEFSAGPNIALSVYLLSSFMLDVVQFRFFFASAVAFWSLRFLARENNFKNNILFLVSLLLASTIHPVVLVYLLFYGTRFDVKLVKRFSIAASAVILILLYSGVAQSLAPLIVGELRAERYFYALSKVGYLPYAAIALVPIIFNLRIGDSSFMESARPALEQGVHFAKRCKGIDWIKFIRVACFCMLPVLCTLILRPEEFFRPVRLLIIALVMPLTTVYTQDSKIEKKGKIKYASLAAVWLLLSFMFCYRDYFGSVIAQLFENNLLL